MTIEIISESDDKNYLKLTGTLNDRSEKISNAIERIFRENSSKKNGDLCMHVILASDQTIHNLNLQYRKKDEDTDVLTFEDTGTADREESEIYISCGIAASQAMQFGHSIEDETTLLMIHGLLHACGLDHEKSESDAKFMRMKEKEVLESIGLSFLEPVTVEE